MSSPDHRPVIPDRAAEDDPRAWGERPDDSHDRDDDARFLDERPPHHRD